MREHQLHSSTTAKTARLNTLKLVLLDHSQETFMGPVLLEPVWRTIDKEYNVPVFFLSVLKKCFALYCDGFIEYTYTQYSHLFLSLYFNYLCSFLPNRVWPGSKHFFKVPMTVYFSYNFNSCCKRLCEVIGPNLRKNYCCAMTIYVCLA